MGSEQGETPVHKVTISKAFYLGKYEVTQEQWQATMGENPSQFKGPKNPVENVSWDDCQSFLEKLSKKFPGRPFRLPTEAEWEYACRAGSAAEYCYGDDVAKLGEYAWYESNSVKTTHPVGQKKPNAWGLYDVHGNVWEWCADWLAAYSGDDQRDPKGARAGVARVLRGGSWSCDARDGRAADRDSNAPGARYSYGSGLRAARTLE
jgi:formylglycine-generating enzyme required for sulfatase activity